MAETKRDYYEVLGVAKGASDDEIKKAYRKAAKACHPDLHPDDKEAEARFKELNEAHEVLSDPQKRARYDQFGHEDPRMGGGGAGYGGFGGFEDIFDMFTGGGFGGFGGGRSAQRQNAPQRGSDLQYNLQLTFEEAAFGCKKEFKFQRDATCDACNGSGAKPGTQPQTCPTCGGSGQQRVTMNSPFGQVQTMRTCQTCGGRGQVNVQQRTPFGVMSTTKQCTACGGKGKTIPNPCTKCKGAGVVAKPQTVEIDIPAGIDDRQALNVRGGGNPGANGGPTGDLRVNVNVRPHPFFERDGFDVWCEVTVTYAQAALGDTLYIPTLDGKVKYELPAGTQPGEVFRFRNRGIQQLQGRGKGDQFVKIVVDVPKNLNQKQKDLLRQFDSTLTNKPKNNIDDGTTVGEEKKSFFDRFK
mgnify:CR=1 FL=1